MFKNFLIGCIVLTASLKAVELSDTFSIDQAMMYVDNLNFTIKNGTEELGFIRRRISGNVFKGRKPQYELYSRQEGLEAIAQPIRSEKLKRAVFMVEDLENNFLGTIEEDWKKGYFLPSWFEIYSADQILIAKGYFSDIFDHIFVLFDPIDEHIFAKITCSFPWTSWKVQIQDPQFQTLVDPRLFLLLTPIFMDAIQHSGRLSKKATLSR